MSLTVRIPYEDTRSADALLADGWQEGSDLVTYWRQADIGSEDGTRIDPRIILPINDIKQQVINCANAAFDPKDKTNWIQDAWDRPDRHIFFNRRGFELAGFIIMRAEPNIAVVDLIGVNPWHQKLGIGEKLIDRAHRYAWQNNLQYVQAGTHVGNEAARKFYGRLGFTVKHVKRTFHK